MKIRLNDIRLFARHGVMPDEQTIGAWFRVSLCATIGSDSAAITDNLDETINYAMMADIVNEGIVPANTDFVWQTVGAFVEGLIIELILTMFVSKHIVRAVRKRLEDKSIKGKFLT